eukprot:Skav206405  [mRNA]  locus=scaffold2210:128049:131943:+ [translate_table: standard]
MAFTVSARLAATKAVIAEEMPRKSWVVWLFVLMDPYECTIDCSNAKGHCDLHVSVDPENCKFTCQFSSALCNPTGSDQSLFAFDGHQIPAVLQKACSIRDFDWLKYQACAAQSLFSNSCIARANACRLNHVSRSAGDFIDVFLFVCLPSFSFFVWLLVLFGSFAYFKSFFLINACEDRDLRKAVRRRANKLEKEMCQRSGTFVGQTRAYFALSMFLLDFASDVSCIAQFVLSGNFVFGTCQALIVLVAGATEFYKGNLKELLHSFQEFRKTGVPPDRFLSILQAEQSLEAPLSFLLQYYSAYIIPAGSDLAFVNLGFSIAMSLYGISKGVYENLHLNMEDAFEAAEELADSEPATPHAQLMGLSPSMAAPTLVAPTAAPLPPPPGMAPTAPLPPPPGMGVAVAQPSPPVAPVQIGGRVKDTE